MYCRHILPLILLSCPAVAAAQYGAGTQRLMGNKRGDVHYNCRRIYLGISTGINNPVGLAGAQIDVAVSSRVSANLGAGIGTWGLKAALEGRYYFAPCNRGFALGLGGTYHTGYTAKSVENVNTINGKETAVFDLLPAFNLMLSGYYFVSLGASGHRAHFQGGYSLPLHSNRIDKHAGAPLDPSARQPLAITGPGGPVIAAGISIGLGNL